MQQRCHSCNRYGGASKTELNLFLITPAAAKKTAGVIYIHPEEAYCNFLLFINQVYKLSMKIYQFKYREIFITDSIINEERFAEAYNKLLDESLNLNSICSKKNYEAFNLNAYTVTSKYYIIESLLRKNILPAFLFLIAKN